MNKLLSIVCGLLLVISNSSVPATAATSSSSCNNTLKLVKNSLSGVVTFKTRALGNEGQPRGRSKALDITFKNDSDRVFPTESTRRSITTRVIKNCTQIALVSFGVYQTDGGSAYGLKNGRIIQFACREPGEGRKLVWGEVYCP